MGKKAFYYFTVATFLVLLVFVDCAPQQSKSCSECEQALEKAKNEIAELQQKLANIQQELNSAHALIEELRKTPEQIYKGLVEKASNVNDSTSTRTVIEEIDSFILKNPTSPLSKSAQQLKMELQKKLKSFEAEEARRAALLALGEIKALLAGVKDGTELDAIALVKLARRIEESFPLRVLKQLPKTTYKAAMKDPDAERGAIISASGRVIQIRKELLEGNFTIYKGQLVKSDFNVIYFIALGSTNGIYEDSWATFTGVFSQVYYYPNVSGGTTPSVVAVGYFDIPQNR